MWPCKVRARQERYPVPLESKWSDAYQEKTLKIIVCGKGNTDLCLCKVFLTSPTVKDDWKL